MGLVPCPRETLTEGEARVDLVTYTPTPMPASPHTPCLEGMWWPAPTFIGQPERCTLGVAGPAGTLRAELIPSPTFKVQNS